MHAHLHANICFGHLPVYMLWNAVGLFFSRAAEPQRVIFADEMLDSEIYSIIVSKGVL